MRSDFLPFARPMVGEEEIAEVVDSLRSGWITTGPKTKQFQDDFAKAVGAQHAIAVNSCTGALHLSLAALGVGGGDEVIVSTLTFCSACNVVVHLGAEPVLVDVGEDFNVSAAAIEDAITERTAAIMLTHFAGQSCDLESIYAVAERAGIPVVEDAAHATGTSYRRAPIGSDEIVDRYAGDGARSATCFSFYPIKNMTTGEGGMITTSDKELAERMTVLSLHGMSHDAWKRYSAKGSWFYEVVEAGFKYNMTDLQAAMGIHQLRRLPGFIARRREMAARYLEAFEGLPGVRLPVVHDPQDHAFHLFVLRVVANEAGIHRDDFIRELADRNIGTSVHFIPVHRHPYYSARCQGKSFPVAEELFDQIVSLPLYPLMSDADLDDVVKAVREVLAAAEGQQ